MKIKTFILLLIAAIIILLLPLSAEAVKFVLTPPRFEFTMSPGSSATEGVEIYNLENSDLELKAYLADWELDAQGELKYKRAGAMKTSCSGWVKVNPQNVKIGPKDSRLVRFTVTAPPGTAGSYWTVIFFESKPSAPAKGQTGVTFAGRVGVLIYAVISGTESRSGKILDLKVLKDKANNYNLAVTFENSGNVHYRPKGSWEIKNEAGKKIKKEEMEEFLVLPKTQRTKEFPLGTAAGPEALAPGKYTLSVELDYGAKDLVGGDLNFEIPGAPPAKP